MNDAPNYALYEKIYIVCEQIPHGTVASYGDIAAIVGGGCDARTVGYALNEIPKQRAGVPWQRIISKAGGISTRGLAQRQLLEQEGVEFDARGEKPKLVRIIGSQGAGPGQVDGPEGVSRDVNGDLYVTDEHNRRIVVFDAEGRPLRAWSVPQDPQCVTVFGDRVYVSLDKRNYSACYSKDGVEQFRIGHEAFFPMVLYVTIPGAVVGLVLFMALRKTKLALMLCGGFLLSAAAGGGIDFARHHQPGEYRLPDYIAVSPDRKELYIVDRLNNRIQVTDLEGHFKRLFGRPGTAPGHLNDPKQLAFDPDGNVWVADSDNNRLQVFSPDGKFLRIVE